MTGVEEVCSAIAGIGRQSSGAHEQLAGYTHLATLEGFEPELGERGRRFLIWADRGRGKVFGALQPVTRFGQDFRDRSMQSAAFARHDGRRSGRSIRWIDELDAIACEAKCSDAFDLDEDVEMDSEMNECGAHDPDLARGIDRDDVERAPDRVGRLIGLGAVGGGSRRFDLATVASLGASVGRT